MKNPVFPSIWNHARNLSLLALVITALGCSDTAETDSTQIESTVPNPALVWNFSLWGNPRAGTEAAEALSRLVAEHTNQAWQIQLHYGEALSKSRENLDGLAIEAFEGAMVCNFYHPKKNPALMVLTLPFLPLETEAKNRAVRKAVYSHPAVIEEFSRWNATLYTSTYLPQYEILGTGSPPINIEDWQGRTVRAGGGIGLAMRLLGATPASSTATEVYTGVQQGTMDAASFPFTYGHVSYRINEVTDWFTSNLAPGTSDCPVVFATSAYEALPIDYKQLLTDIRDEVDDAQFKAYQDVDAVNIPMLREMLEEVRYTQEQRNELRETVGRQVIEDWIQANQDGFDARGLVDLIFEAAGETF